MRGIRTDYEDCLMKIKNNFVPSHDLIDAYYKLIEARIALYGQVWDFWSQALLPYQLDKTYQVGREAHKKGGGFWPHYGE